MGFVDYFRLQFGFKFYSLKQIKAMQFKSIQRLFTIAQANAPYYANMNPNNGLKSWDDFYHLPTMDKTILMNHFDTINTKGLRRADVEAFALDKEARKDYTGYFNDQYVVGLSSGTSGNKGLYLTDKALTKKLPMVFLARSGLSLKYLPFRILFCLRVFSQGFADINSPIIKLNYVSTMTPIEKVIEDINLKKINILMAPPSFIRLMLPYRDQFKSRLKCIVCYAEVLTSEEKEKFKNFFQCKVIEIYQASEGQMASACKEGNLHLNEDLVFAELVDHEGKEVTQAGIPGQLVITNLINEVQPLFRYRMNDWVVLKESCPCGSHYRVLDHVIGRQDDVMMFMTSDSTLQYVFPDLISRWIITYSNEIREFKALQKELNAFDLTIDCHKTQVTEAFIKGLEERLLNEFQAFKIKPKLSIQVCELAYPKDNSKFKRFEIRKEKI
jgi:putative adenylate-forming enzyme